MKRLKNKYESCVKSMAALCMGVTACFALAACEDDDNTVQTPLQVPVATCTETTWRSLSFEWTEIEGAAQYSYILKDAEGNPVYGDVTTGTNATIGDLDSGTAYTLYIRAYPLLGSETTLSETAVLQMQTPLINLTGTYVSALATRNETWNAVLEEPEQNKFVIKNWYGADGYDLEFRVNPEDGAISVLNGELDKATGFKKVATGSTNAPVKNGTLINEAQSNFNRPGCQLTLTVKATSGTRAGEDTFTWE